MTDRPTHRVARGVALALSLGLASFVIINAQFGCDSPASNTAPPKDTVPVEPPPSDEPDDEPEPPAQPTKPDSESAVEPAAEPSPAKAIGEQPVDGLVGAGRGGVGESEPVFMPASKSGGNFGAVRFPGEQGPAQQAEPQQQNPAPQQK